MNLTHYYFDFSYSNDSNKSQDIVMGESNGEAKISVYSKDFD
jgi:hypothetical protein